MKKILLIALAAILLFSFMSCKKKTGSAANSAETGENGQNSENGAAALPDVVTGSISFKDYGIVTFELYPNQAPQSCLNFIYLINKGYYNGIIVDRIVSDLLIQAGDYQSGFVPRSTEFDYSIKGEFSENGVENNLNFVDGAIAWMYPNNDYNGAHTSFAIFPKADTAWSMAGKHAVFGKVTGEESFNILSDILAAETYQDKPTTEIMIISASIDPVNQEGFTSSYQFPEPDFIKK